jgi:ribosomal protein S19
VYRDMASKRKEKKKTVEQTLLYSYMILLKIVSNITFGIYNGNSILGTCTPL